MTTSVGMQLRPQGKAKAETWGLWMQMWTCRCQQQLLLSASLDSPAPQWTPGVVAVIIPLPPPPSPVAQLHHWDKPKALAFLWNVLKLAPYSYLEGMRGEVIVVFWWGFCNIYREPSLPKSQLKDILIVVVSHKHCNPAITQTQNIWCHT